MQIKCNLRVSVKKTKQFSIEFYRYSFQVYSFRKIQELMTTLLKYLNCPFDIYLPMKLYTNQTLKIKYIYIFFNNFFSFTGIKNLFMKKTKQHS